MTATDNLLDAARRYSENRSAADAGLPAAPATGVALVVCMDARIDVYSLFGLRPGDAHVIRNAGGLVTDDAIRSLAISQRFLGTTEVVLVHHTRCGMQGLDDEDFAKVLESESGVRPGWKAGGFTDVTSDVAQSLEAVRRSPWLPHRDKVRGFVFDVDSGRLEEVG